MELSMKGRTALITGGSTGLGKAMARRFAQSGAQVAIVARRADVLESAREELQAEVTPKILAFPCDVTDPEQIKATFAKVESDLAPVDVLVNNAGVSRAMPFEKITDEDWEEDFSLKVFGAIRLARLAFPGMKARRWGRIINILNTGAKAPRAGGAPTVVSRAAGMAITKVLAGEGAPHNVLVNALCTGIIESDQWARRHAAENKGRSYEEFLAEMGKPLAMGRVGTSEEFANMACFLASDAGSYINGTAINVDGGNCPVV